VSKLGKIIRMEFRLTVANKVFVILTLIGPFLIAGVTLLPTLLAGSEGAMGSSPTRIAFLGADPGFVQQIAPTFQDAKIEVSAVQGSVAELDALVQAGKYDGYLLWPADLSDVSTVEYTTKTTADVRVMGLLQSVIERTVVVQRLVDAGIPASRIESLIETPTVTNQRLLKSGEKTEGSDFLTVLMTGITFAMLLYVTLLLYGQVIARSVLIEKTNKTVEIMLSSVRPMELLFGKILGKAAASLLQYGIWVVLSVLFLKLIGPHIGMVVGLEISAGTIAYLVLFFIVSFFLYCSLYAALGAVSEDEQHLGQLSWPIVIFLVIPIVMISPIISTPQAPVIVVLSFFPFTAPVVMFLRILVGAATLLEVVISLAIIMATTAGVIWLSARIFSAGILVSGRRFKLKELLGLVRCRTDDTD